MLTNCTSECSFFMSEEFTIYGTLRNRATVNRYIGFAATFAVVVNDARNDFLAHTAFALNEHREVGRCD